MINSFLKKRIYHFVDVVIQADYRVNWKESKEPDKYQDLARERKNAAEHEDDGDTNHRLSPYNSLQQSGKDTDILNIWFLITFYR